MNSYQYAEIYYLLPLSTILQSTEEVGVYKRKQEKKKARKHAFGQENDQEKKKVFFYFSCSFFLVESVFSVFFLFFLIVFLVESVFSCFLTFWFSFMNSHLRRVIQICLRCVYLYF